MLVMHGTEYDTIDERREEPRSAVESLASLVYRLMLAYLWIWIAIAAIGVLGVVIAAIKHAL